MRRALLAALLSSACLGATVTVASRSGRACLFEPTLASSSVPAAIASAPVVARDGSVNFTAMSMAYWFRAEVSPTTTLYPVLSYAQASGTGLPSPSSRVAKYAALGGQSTAYLELATVSPNNRTTYSHTGVKAVREWVHVASTWDGHTGLVTLFENGEVIARGTGFKGALPTGKQFFFPDMQWASRLFGLADEITAWSAALTEAEVRKVAGGDVAVRQADLILRIPCDESEDEVDDANDTVYNAASKEHPATVIGPHVPRVPSQGPKADVGFSVVAVSAGAPTDLVFPEDVHVTSASKGSFSVQGKTVTYTPPAGGPGTEGAVLKTSLGHVFLVPNTPPAPRDFAVSVHEMQTVVLTPVFYSGPKLSRWFMYQTDAEGQFLTVKVAAVPAAGRLFQYDGTPITAAGTLVSDTMYRLKFNASEDDYGKNATIVFDVSDGVDTTQSHYKLHVVEPVVLPAPIGISVDNVASEVALTLADHLDPRHKAAFIITDPPEHGKLLDASGAELVYRPMTRYVAQWASELVNFSSEYNDDTHEGHYGAVNVLGAPQQWPEADGSVLSWSAKDPPDDPTAQTDEWIVVRYAEAVHLSRVFVLENLYSNNTWKIEALDEDTAQWVTVSERAKQTAVMPMYTAQKYDPEISAGLYPFRTRTLRVNVHYVGRQFPQIDAIMMVGYQPVMAARLAGNKVRYVPTKGFRGADNFTYNIEFASYAAMEVIAATGTSLYATPTAALVSLAVHSPDQPEPAVSSEAVVEAYDDGCTDNRKVKGLVAALVVSAFAAVVAGIAAVFMCSRARKPRAARSGIELPPSSGNDGAIIIT
eukprot:m51a1_g145 hypothetical protein (817) ;mRNA; f:466213-469011